MVILLIFTIYASRSSPPLILRSWNSSKSKIGNLKGNRRSKLYRGSLSSVIDSSSRTLAGISIRILQKAPNYLFARQTSQIPSIAKLANILGVPFPFPGAARAEVQRRGTFSSVFLACSLTHQPRSDGERDQYFRRNARRRGIRTGSHERLTESRRWRYPLFDGGGRPPRWIRDAKTAANGRRLLAVRVF